MRYRIAIASVVSSFWTIASIAAADAKPIDAAWIQKLREECEPAFQRYVFASENLDVRVEMRVEKTSDDPGGAPFRSRTEHQRIARLKPNALFERKLVFDNDKSDPDTLIDVDNVDYSFKLKSNRPNQYVLLKEFKRSTDRERLVDISMGMHKECYLPLESVLEGAKNNEKYKLATLHYEEQNRLLLAKVVYPIDDGSTVEHEMWIQPDHGWRITKYVKTTKSAIIHADLEYGGEILAGLTFPSSVLLKMKYKVAGVPWFQIHGRIVELAPTRLSVSDFRLAAFDIPEPVDTQVPASRGNLMTYLVAAACALALAAGAFGYLGRRGRGTSSITTSQ